MVLVNYHISGYNKIIDGTEESRDVYEFYNLN
jgi:hypothetical protein